MARPRLRPDDATLRAWFEEGISCQEMADRWAETTNIHLSRMAFQKAVQEADWYEPKYTRHVGTDLMPWTDIRLEHAHGYEVQMLRREALRRAGHKFPDHDTEIQRLNAWLQGLRDADAVIAYKRDTQQGWWRVKREHTDLDIVRLPEGYKPQDVSQNVKDHLEAP